VTANPNHLDAIADAEAALTPAVIAARKAALDARNQAIWDRWANSDSALAIIDAQIVNEQNLLGAASTQLTADQARQASMTTVISTLNSQISSLQDQIAQGGPPATAADVAERDEVVQLRAEVGV
jgi:chromosome segregation ATPase